MSTNRDHLIINGERVFNPNVLPEHDYYDASELDTLYRYEKKHFWFRYRREVIYRFFQKYVNREERVIEVGAGTGSVSRHLLSNGYDISVGELHLSGLKYAKSYGIQHRYQFDLLETPFEGEFDVVALFDVLEHIEDDELALANINKMLKTKGKVVITVPAGQWLWSAQDDIANHKRRYTIEQLTKKIKDAGFELIDGNYFFIGLVPILALRKILHPKGSENKEALEKTNFKISALVNTILYGVCKLDFLLGKLKKHIFGGSIIIIAKK